MSLLIILSHYMFICVFIGCKKALSAVQHDYITIRSAENLYVSFYLEELPWRRQWLYTHTIIQQRNK